MSLNLLTNDIAANQIAQQMGQMQPQGFGAEDPDKLFQNEAENLEVIEHKCILDGIADRILAKYGM